MIDGIVAIVGRPNVGKSTLFNRLTRSEGAIVDDQPGVTRDRIYGTVWSCPDEQDDGFALIDTGGFEKDDFKFQPFSENLVWQQTEMAIKEADLVVLLLDGKDGVHPHDHELVRFLERTNKEWIGVVNKIDGAEHASALLEFYELGIGHELEKISAAHNRGVVDLKEKLLARLRTLPACQRTETVTGAARIAIVGRPNAGKSSILNRIAGEERAVVSEIAGTTRDVVDTPLNYHGRKFVLVDTAGIRRKSKIHDRLESVSVVRSIRAIDRADVVLLVLDAMAGLTEQDMRLASLCIERWRPLLIVVNKWDLVPEKETNTARNYADNIHRVLKTGAFAPVIFVSCLSNQRVHKLIELAAGLADESMKRVPTAAVNNALRKMVAEHNPALIKGKTKRVKFYFATQVAANPPTIVVKSNVYNEIQESYIRYMHHSFRALLGFERIPLRLIFRPKNSEKGRGPRDNLPDGLDELPDELSDIAPIEVDASDAAFAGSDFELREDGVTIEG